MLTGTNNTLILPVCSHRHRCKHTVAPKHSFLGETMASTNETMFNTPTKNKNGKSLSKVGKKNDFVQSFNTAGVRVVSVHCIDCIRLIVDGIFVIVISVIAVCCVADFVFNIDDVDVKEKTHRKPWQQTQEEDPTCWVKGKRTQTGCLQHWLVWHHIDPEQMFEAHFKHQSPIHSRRKTNLPS